MSINVQSHKKTLLFKVKGTFDAEQIAKRYKTDPIESHLASHQIVKVDLKDCKRIEKGSIHWLGTLYKRCCHMDKRFRIDNPPPHIKAHFEANDIAFLLDPKEANDTWKF